MVLRVWGLFSFNGRSIIIKRVKVSVVGVFFVVFRFLEFFLVVELGVFFSWGGVGV